MPLILFQPRFAGVVADGTKCQTIRKTRKRPIKEGDKLILGTWEGIPYRSKVRRLGEAVCTEVKKIVIGDRATGVGVTGAWLILSDKQRDKLAVADGFGSRHEMLAWFRETHGLPFHGVLIRWECLTTLREAMQRKGRDWRECTQPLTTDH